MNPYDLLKVLFVKFLNSYDEDYYDLYDEDQFIDIIVNKIYDMYRKYFNNNNNVYLFIKNSIIQEYINNGELDQINLGQILDNIYNFIKLNN